MGSRIEIGGINSERKTKGGEVSEVLSHPEKPLSNRKEII